MRGTVCSASGYGSFVKYVILLAVMASYIYAGLCLSDYLYNENGRDVNTYMVSHGPILTAVVFVSTAGIYLSLPFTAINTLGIALLNPFTKKHRQQSPVKTDLPFICFRAVTRGTFPQLVKTVTEQNLATVLKHGIKNFKFDVVTDKSVNLPPSHYVSETVVPSSYRTPNGTLFKARALHYCLHEHVNILSADDWIVHLDEETRLTEGVLDGIVDFVSKPTSNIGQGVITYGEGDVENWITTLMDGMRTAIDYGMFRFALSIIHRPVFGFKGSFIVIKMEIEKAIGFDFGPKESIAEDLRFALTAWDRGYRFDFVDGIMQEKSTFTIADFVKQRKRWLIGHFHIIWSNSLPVYVKMAVFPLHMTNLLLWVNVLNTVISVLDPLPVMKWQLTTFITITTSINFMIVFGNFISLGSRRHHVVTKTVLCMLSQILLPVLCVLEAYASLLGLAKRNTLVFEIVQKETRSKTTASVLDV